MKKTFWLCIIGGIFLGTSCKVTPPDLRDSRPNILLLMVDDMGFSDPACFGGEIHTPNLDRLAFSGIRFTQFYNAGRCCPTRASLLTGKYPHQAGIGRMTKDLGPEHPGYRGFLNPQIPTLAEVLKERGYQTGMVGKWHVSLTPTIENPEEQLRWLNHQAYPDRDFGKRESYPTARGFDRYFGNIWGVVNYFDPFSLVNGEEPVQEVPDDFYLTDAISDTAVAYLRNFGEGREPFFLYVAHCAPHWPLHALPEDIDKYASTYEVGWDSIRKARFERQIEMGLFEPDNFTAPIEREQSWDEEPNRTWEAGVMAAHAAMVDRVDQGLGRILAELEEQNLLENTLILFLSDNGASPERYPQPGFDRNSETRMGEKVSYLSPDRPSGPETTYDYIGKYWANVANTPFQFWKAYMNEGGTCTPMIAHWPAGIHDQAGSINTHPGHIVDIMATCLELSDREATSDQPEVSIEGESLVPLFETGTRHREKPLFFEHFNRKALRLGDWKIVAQREQPWELYDLQEDRTEKHNVVKEYPELAERLSQVWDSLAQVYQVELDP